MKLSLAIAAELVFAASSYGLTTVQVAKSDLTSTQAIVRVQTDQSGFCTYRISEGGSFSLLVNDVNTALFSLANSDARPGSIITGLSATRVATLSNGSEHVFVAGTRTATKAADGKFYSRTLQANTLHWVGATCGADAEVSTTFQTLNPPLGNDGPELMPFDATAFGNVAVPTINWTNRAATYNDPMLGTQLHRMTGPGDIGFYAAANTFSYGISANGHWTSPGNAISAGSSSLANCNTATSCTTSDALALIAVIQNNTTNFVANGAWDPTLAYTDFLVRMWGSGTDSNAANRTVAVCWSIDDQTCFTSSQNIALPQSTSAFAGTAPQSWSVQSPWTGVTATKLTNIVVSGGVATINFAAAHGLAVGGQICVNGIRNQSVTTAQGGNGLNGCFTIATVPTASSLTFASNASPGTYTDSQLIGSPGFPQALWASWGVPPPHNLVGLHTGGTVTATSGAVVLTNSGTQSIFDPGWVSGAKIFIAGSSPTCNGNLCTVSSVTDALHLTLVENLTISAAAWTSANFSLLVKKTTSTGAVSVSAGYDFIYSAQYTSGLDGDGDIGNSNPVTISVDANGNAISPAVQGYLVVASATSITNSTTPIYVFIPSTGETRLIARGFQPSANDYRPWIGWHPTNGNCWFTNYPSQGVFQACYNGDYRALTPGFQQGTTDADTPEQVTFTDIFAGNSIISQIANCQTSGSCNSGINSTLFGVPPSPPQTGAAIKGNYMVMCGAAIGGAQNFPGYVTMWNIASVPAVLTWVAYTFDTWPASYSGIHACLNFGNGQFNAVGLNVSAGSNNPALPFAGPWRQTPTMYNSGSGFTSNTAVGQTDGFDCPAGLSAQWQTLGAKPVASGGVARCLEFIVPGDFCSINSTAAESAAFPCPTSPLLPTSSLIKPIGEGDEIGDATYGSNTFGEKMVIVKVTRNSPTNIDIVVFRYGNAAVTPAAGFTCGTYNSSEWTHANGWTMYAMPYKTCSGQNFWSNALDSTHAWITENPNIIGQHSDFGQGSNGYSFIEGGTLSGYVTRANQPMPQQIGGPPTAQPVANPTFGSAQLPDIYLQSYPSKRQQSALTPPSEMDWALDVRHYNPSNGNAPESPEGLLGNTVTLVSGHAQTYLITFAGNQAPDPKVVGFVGWAGYHMLADASGPSSASTFGDSTSWRYCYAYAAGECVSGSTVGKMYVSIPAAFTSFQCLVNTYAYNAPCISNNYPYGFWVTQWNTTATERSGISSRRLTSALIAPGRQYNFTNAKTTPDARWVQVQAEWLEGQRTDMFWMKLPPLPGRASNPGTTLGATNLSLQVSGVPGDTIRVAFGYAENGDPANFYCTSRAEACYTAATAGTGSPFVYAGETQAYISCSTRCTVPIPAVPGRILYYQLQRQNGSNNSASALGVIAVQ